MDTGIIVRAVDKHRDIVLRALEEIWKHPETGYKEWKTTAYAEKVFEDLGYELVRAGDIPGFYTDVDTGRPGPSVAVLGELDSVICAAHPDAEFLVHLECPPEVAALADGAMSTGGMLRRVRESAKTEFIIGTEVGILHRLMKENPEKRFHALAPEPICADMKTITAESLLAALRELSGEVRLVRELMDRARRPIVKMLEIS